MDKGESMKPKIAILMSTYNGEKYLEEQIDSIVGQTNNDWQLFIRDDNSTDGTREIIRKYVKKFQNITFINENKNDNIGVCRSFMTLLQHTDADFYMFSDQDDVWKSEKVNHTLAKINEAGSSVVPALVYTDLEIVDATLSKIGRMYGDRVWVDFTEFLFTNCATGCTVMFNQSLKRLINFEDTKYEDIYMHDWWLAMLAAQFGKIIYLNEETIKYRQHEGNVVGSGEENTFNRLLARFVFHKSDVIHAQQIVRAAHEFYRLYGGQVKGKDRSYLIGYGSLYEKSSFWHNLHLVLKMPALRINPKGRLFYSYLFVVFSKKYRFINR